MLEKERTKLILNALRIKENFLDEKTSKKGGKLKLYKDYLYDNLKKLERIECTSTRNEVELELENYTRRDAFDWQLKIVFLNNIFGTMLGIIDARNDDCKKDLEFHQKFDNQSRIASIKKDQEKLTKYREVIIEDYLNTISKDIPVITETIKTEPCYENFPNLLNDIKENNYQLSLQGQFVSAYMYGYNNSLYVLPDEIIEYYKEILLKYNNIKEKNEKQVEKVKTLNNKIKNN